MTKICQVNSILHFGALPFRRAIQWITANKNKNILIHYQDNALMYPRTKN